MEREREVFYSGSVENLLVSTVRNRCKYHAKATLSAENSIG
jgi:hypothetical protein